MDISRRTFIKAASGTVAVAAVPAVLTGCAGIQREDLPPFDPIGEQLNAVDGDIKQILFLSSLAPSGHNTQPWKIVMTDKSHWTILSDRDRWLPAVDPTKRETLLSIGAFIENLSQAAGSYGREVAYEVTAKSSNDTEIAHITIARQKTSGDSRQKIISRRTVRKGFSGKELSSADVRAVTDADGDHFHYYPFSSPQGTYLNTVTVEANRVQVAREEAQRELADWIRWSDNEAKKNRDGLTPEGMEISGLAGWYVRHFYDKQDVLSKDFREKTIEGVIEQTGQHGGWLVITSAEQDVPTLLETGRRFEKMFLRVRDRSIAIHPMTQALEEAPYRDQVAHELEIDSHVQFLLRAGYLDTYPDPVTLRRPVEWFART